MKHAGRMLGTVIAMVIVGALVDVAKAAEIKIFCAFGMREVLEDLAPKFERASGHKLVMTFGNLGNIVKRVRAGETADIVLVPQQGIDGLVKEGRATAGNTTVIARGGIGIAVRTGAPKPDISTADALKRALLVAKSITYLDPAGGGVSGVHFSKVLAQLGIADDVRPKTILHGNSNEAAVLIAQGKAEIGVNLIQELLPKPDIDVVGPLPGGLQFNIVYSAGIISGATNAEAAKALIDFMRSGEAAIVIKAKGMEPG